MSSKNGIHDHPRPIPVLDESQLTRLFETARRARKSLPKLADQLLEGINRADFKSTRDIPSDVVRVGSWVRYRDDETGATNLIQIVYPEAADLTQRRISVLTPVGAALLGLSAGQEIAWMMSDGRTKRLAVLDVKQVRDPPIAH